MGIDRRVVHIAPGEPFGGVQKVVLELSAAQRARGRDVSVIWTGASSQVAKLSAQRGVPTHLAQGCLPYRWRTVRLALRRLDPEIVHLHMAPPWVLPLLPETTLNCFHLHGGPIANRSIKAKLAAVLEGRLIDRSDVVIAISIWISQQWQALHPRANLVLAYNGVPTGGKEVGLHLHIAGKPSVIGFASRLAADKGVREFVDIVLEMSKVVPDAYFLVAGDGPERAGIEISLASLIAAGRVELLGHVVDMQSFWERLDLAVFCAPAEPFGLRLIEPLVHEVPVIAYRTEAGSDEIADLCAGIQMVPYGDVDAIAELGRKLLSDPDRRSAIAAAGRRDVLTRFSVDTMVDRIDQIYTAGWRHRFTKS